LRTATKLPHVMHRAVADFQMGFLSRRVRAHDRCASFYPNALEVWRGIVSRFRRRTWLEFLVNQTKGALYESSKG
jgi:hypothetical protein